MLLNMKSVGLRECVGGRKRVGCEMRERKRVSYVARERERKKEGRRRYVEGERERVKIIDYREGE
jgi:hypothetical protein